MRHAARRFSLSGTAPPFRGRRVTATPYAPAALLVADRPFPPPLPRPRRADDRASAPRALEPPPPPPPPPHHHHHHRHTHTHTRRRASSARRHTQLKRKRKKGMRRPAGETPRLCNTLSVLLPAPSPALPEAMAGATSMGGYLATARARPNSSTSSDDGMVPQSQPPEAIVGSSRRWP